MDVLIAGGHGKIARLLIRILAADGHTARGLIRNPDHAADLAADGGVPVLCDLEREDPSPHAAGADAIVFAAGAGPGSGAARKLSVDLGAAVLLIEAAQRAGIDRYVMVSAISADAYDPNSEDVFQVYLRAKSEADHALRESGLDWTIVRPGGLTNGDATGLVRIAAKVPRGQIPRTDVASVLRECLREPRSIGAQFELVSGDTPIPDAVAGLRAD
ncbi:MAG TPA: SDR family oxidoreductase [Solirubrobacteraceae bacterium]|nr:SDR family oxidoreductase [Solirubrobacteraceae bacterium]